MRPVQKQTLCEAKAAAKALGNAGQPRQQVIAEAADENDDAFEVLAPQLQEHPTLPGKTFVAGFAGLIAEASLTEENVGGQSARHHHDFSAVATRRDGVEVRQMPDQITDAAAAITKQCFLHRRRIAGACLKHVRIVRAAPPSAVAGIAVPSPACARTVYVCVRLG